MLRSRLPVVVLLLLAAVAPLVAEGAARAQDGAGEPAFYRSAEFGYLFWWDPAVWAVVEGRTEPGTDWVRLASEDATVDVIGLARPGIGHAACIEALLNDRRREPGVTAVEGLDRDGRETGVGGPPQVYGDEWFSSVDLVSTVEGPGGRTKIASANRCFDLVRGESVVFTAEIIGAEAFNAGGGFVADPVLDTLTLPAAAFPFAPGAEDSDRSHYLGGFVRRAVAGATPVALFTTHNECGSSEAIVVVENLGADVLVGDARSFLAASDESETAPREFAWLAPATGEPFVTLAPGEAAVLALSWPFPPDTFADLLWVSPGLAPPLRLTTFMPCPELAPGGFPVVIDME